MNTFTLQLQDATHTETFAEVQAFVGEDASGSFSLLAGHARFTTVLETGLARFRLASAGTGMADWYYLAVPGAVLHFSGNCLTISSRRYLLDRDYRRISDALQQKLLQEEGELQEMKHSLRQLENEFLRRMWEVGRQGGSLS
ncbi:F0F1 ATP synthase subunit epsilon [Pseudomaricurvus sp. HS19]|uniref:F0F1 ATP synthase subunit epsilon n=1 Tax=Pseudomaricurvus sp. HS19 TaxID=2692626 RepID=UPI00136AA107|nr:F0F1 ATP synthase subunit epsilon [Pseudomaricurvus sp. HS19]